MKKLIILFCGTLALAACGNGLEKKANEKLMVAKAAYERGDYEEAKLQIDSIKILYPKAFEARKAGQALMLDVETKTQQKRLLIWIAPFRQNERIQRHQRQIHTRKRCRISTSRQLPLAYTNH